MEGVHRGHWLEAHSRELHLQLLKKLFANQVLTGPGVPWGILGGSWGDRKAVEETAPNAFELEPDVPRPLLGREVRILSPMTFLATIGTLRDFLQRCSSTPCNPPVGTGPCT